MKTLSHRDLEAVHRNSLYERKAKKKAKTSEFWKENRASGKNSAPSASQEYRVADYERSCLFKNHQIASLSPRS